MTKEQIESYKKSFSNEQMKKITEDYDNGIKITEIIKKYNLLINNTQFPLFLPNKKTNFLCPYCNMNMEEKRMRKKEKDKTLYCMNCGHMYNAYWDKRQINLCNCKNCEEAKKKILEKKQEIIFDYYIKEIPLKNVSYSELPVELQVLLYLFYIELDVFSDFTYINISKMDINLENGVVKKIWKSLYDNNLISVSPLSPISAFEESEIFPQSFYIWKVDYVVNIDFTDEEIDMLKNRKIDIRKYPFNEIHALTHKFMFEDMLENFENLLAERNIKLEPSEIQKDNFKLLFHELSYAQISYLCYKVAIFYSDSIQRSAIPKYKVSKQAMGTVITFYHNSMERFGSVYQSNNIYAGAFLKKYITNVLKLSLDVLKGVI